MINIEKVRRDAVENRYRAMSMPAHEILTMADEIIRLRRDLEGIKQNARRYEIVRRGGFDPQLREEELDAAVDQVIGREGR